MLYVTTRDQKDAFTAHRALSNDLAPDGGRFIPFKMPTFDQEYLAELKDKAFGQIVSEIINTFFSVGLSGWDVDFCIGKIPVQLFSMNHRVCVSENWHNSMSAYNHSLESINNKICKNNNLPTSWFATSVRIAYLFAIYGQMLSQDLIAPGTTFDVAVNGDDFSDPMAAWYARKMGLPIENIICTCVDNSVVWDLLNKGSFSGGHIDKQLQLSLEQLLCGALGHNVAVEFFRAASDGRGYSICEALLPELNKGLYCAVVGKDRADTTINSVYRSNGYVLDQGAALSYGGMQDYRAKTGSTSMTLVLSDAKPRNHV